MNACEGCPTPGSQEMKPMFWLSLLCVNNLNSNTQRMLPLPTMSGSIPSVLHSTVHWHSLVPGEPEQLMFHVLPWFWFVRDQGSANVLQERAYNGYNADSGQGKHPLGIEVKTK